MPLSALMELHHELDDVFLLHQEALMELRFDLAGDALAAYVRLLFVHMRHEEELILPLYERSGPAPRWPVALYTGQHEKMRLLLESFGSQLIELRKREHDRRRGALALITDQATYKHLMEHHDGAEREGLYAEIDRLASPDEQAELSARCQREWREATARETELLEWIRRALD